MKRPFFCSIIAIMLILCTTPLLHAGAGRTAAQFLSLGGGTRPAALGDAFSAIKGDVNAAFWNPSGLMGIQKTEATLGYTDYSKLFGEAGEGLYYALFAGAMPIPDWGVIATTLQINGQGTIDVTADSPEVIRQESLGTNWAWAVVYSDDVAPGLLAGVSGKVIRQVLGPESSTAYAVDLGAQYRPPNLPIPIALGAAIQNWGTRIQFKDENQSDPLPRTFKIGVALTMATKEDSEGKSLHKVHFMGDFTAFIDKFSEDDEEGLDEFVKERQLKELNKTADEIRSEVLAERGVGIHAFRYGNMSKSIGAEYWLNDMLALRVGYKVDPGIPVEDKLNDRLTFGLGIKYLNYQFDYARVPGGGPENKELDTFALLIRF